MHVVQRQAKMTTSSPVCWWCSLLFLTRVMYACGTEAGEDDYIISCLLMVFIAVSNASDVCMWYRGRRGWLHHLLSADGVHCCCFAKTCSHGQHVVQSSAWRFVKLPAYCVYPQWVGQVELTSQNLEVYSSRAELSRQLGDKWMSGCVYFEFVKQHIVSACLIAAVVVSVYVYLSHSACLTEAVVVSGYVYL